MTDVSLYAGVWLRKVLYEPRDVVKDTLRDSLVMWIQSPHGSFIDIRRVRHEQTPRGFGGYLVANESCLTWKRVVDSMPSCCPTGVDSAEGRFVAADVLMEEGDGYLEVWERVGRDVSARILCGGRLVSSEEEWVQLIQREPHAEWDLTITLGGDVASRIQQEQVPIEVANKEEPWTSLVAHAARKAGNGYIVSLVGCTTAAANDRTIVLKTDQMDY